MDIYLWVLQQLLQGVGCKVREQHLIQFSQPMKEYYPAFPDKGTLDVKAWEDVGDRL